MSLVIIVGVVMIMIAVAASRAVVLMIVIAVLIPHVVLGPQIARNNRGECRVYSRLFAPISCMACGTR